jgi:hypothetical protein
MAYRRLLVAVQVCVLVPLYSRVTQKKKTRNRATTLVTAIDKHRHRTHGAVVAAQLDRVASRPGWVPRQHPAVVPAADHPTTGQHRHRPHRTVVAVAAQQLERAAVRPGWVPHQHPAVASTSDHPTVRQHRRRPHGEVAAEVTNRGPAVGHGARRQARRRRPPAAARRAGGGRGAAGRPGATRARPVDPTRHPDRLPRRPRYPQRAQVGWRIQLQRNARSGDTLLEISQVRQACRSPEPAPSQGSADARRAAHRLPTLDRPPAPAATGAPAPHRWPRAPGRAEGHRPP